MRYSLSIKPHFKQDAFCLCSLKNSTSFIIYYIYYIYNIYIIYISYTYYIYDILHKLYIYIIYIIYFLIFLQVLTYCCCHLSLSFLCLTLVLFERCTLHFLNVFYHFYHIVFEICQSVHTTWAFSSFKVAVFLSWIIEFPEELQSSPSQLLDKMF